MAFRKIVKDSEGGQKYVTEQEEELVFDQAPTKGSFNPVTSDGVANALIVGEGASIGDVVPSDTSAENKLVTETGLQTTLAGDLAPAFDSNRTSETEYKAGDRVLFDGGIYVFKSSHYGAWNALDVVPMESNETTFEIFDIASTNGCNRAVFVNNPTIGQAPTFTSFTSVWNLVCTKLYKGESIYLDNRGISIGAATKYIVIVDESSGLVTGEVEITDGIMKYTATDDCIILFTLHYYDSRSAFAIISRHADEEKLHTATAKYRINVPVYNDCKFLSNGSVGGDVTMTANTGYAVAEETLDVGDKLTVYYGNSSVGPIANQVQVIYDGDSVIGEIINLQSSVTTYTATRPCKVYFSLHTDPTYFAYYIIDKLSISSELTGLYNSASKSKGNPSIVCPKYIDVIDGVQNRNVIFPFDMLSSGNGIDGGYILIKRSGSDYPVRVWDRRPYDFNLSSDTMTVKYIQNNVVITQKTFNTRLVSGNSQPADTTAKICICGDSLIDNNYAASETYKLLLADGYTIRQVGTKSVTYEGVTYNHEGHGGWTYADYIDVNKVGNPFVYNGTINFKHYAESLLSDLPAEERVLDYFLVSLGTNDVGGDRAAAGLLTNAAIASLINNVKTFVDYLKDGSVGFPSCKVAIGLPGLGSLTCNPIFGENIQKFNQSLVDTFDDGSYASGVTCVCHGPYVYREESYQYTDIAVNGYCTDTYRKYGDGIHPKDIGYQQWGFAYYAKLKSMLNGN